MSSPGDINIMGYTVYGLYHPITRKCRYIGSTSHLIKDRYSQHILDARRSDTLLHKWIQLCKFQPVMKTIKECENLQTDVAIRAIFDYAGR